MTRKTVILAALSTLPAWGCGGEGGDSAPKGEAAKVESSKPAGPASASWAEVAPPGGRFSVMMPGKPDEGTSKEPSGDGKEIEHHTFAMVTKPNAYIVDYVDMDFDLPDEGKAGLYDSMRDGNLEARKAKLVEEKPITVDGVVGRDRTDEQDTKMGPFVMKTRSFLAGRRYYTIMASAPKAVLKLDEADKFLDSFHITKAAEGPAKAAPGPDAKGPN